MPWKQRELPRDPEPGRKLDDRAASNQGEPMDLKQGGGEKKSHACSAKHFPA